MKNMFNLFIFIVMFGDRPMLIIRHLMVYRFRDAAQRFKKFYTVVKTESGIPIRILRIDNGK